MTTHAERLLLGTTIADKLAPFPSREPAPHGPFAVPDAPGRPPALAFSAAERSARLPAAQSLRDPARAGELLHAFANHELLAIELMALALLRLPLAPRARRDLVATIEDEQRHLQGYMDRMAQLGTTFGDHPVSRFFWDALSTVETPDAWHAGMGLTLEQANLDFMTWYGRAFREADDVVTAEFLDSVRRDEIAHVARAARALGPGDLYDRWQHALAEPLTPRRARGPTFDRAGREAAGLPGPFIDAVASVGGSRGRPPDVWWFDVTGESDDGAGLLASGPRGDLARDLAWIPLALASPDDLVVLPDDPDPAWLTHLTEAGFPLARRRVVDPRRPTLPEGPVRDVHTWGPGRSTTRLLGAHGTEAPSHHALGDKTVSASLITREFDALHRVFGPGLIDVADLPVVAHDEEDVLTAVQRVRDAGHARVVLKAARSSSGRERIRLLSPHEPDDGQRGWIRRRLRRGPVRVEPWLERVVDLSLHPDPQRWLVTRNDAAGRFRAALPGRPTSVVSSEVARFLLGDGRDPGRLGRLGRALTELVRSESLPGVFGLDAMVVRTAGGLRLHPLLEVNPRWTMGRVALRLARRVHGRSVCAWLHLRPTEARGLLEALPLEVDRSGPTPKLRSGVVRTNDPRATKVATVLVVARSRRSLESVLGRGSR